MACRFCTARRGISQPVIITAPVHRQVCRSHRRRLARPGDRLAEEFDLSTVPDVGTANRRQGRLLRQRDPGAMQEAFRRRGTHPVPLDRTRRLARPPRPPTRTVLRPQPLAPHRTPPADAAGQLPGNHRAHRAADLSASDRPNRNRIERFCAQLRQRLQIPYQLYHARDPCCSSSNSRGLGAQHLPWLHALRDRVAARLSLGRLTSAPLHGLVGPMHDDGPMDAQHRFFRSELRGYLLSRVGERAMEAMLSHPLDAPLEAAEADAAAYLLDRAPLMTDIGR